MTTTGRRQQRDDHRLRDLVQGTGDATIAVGQRHRTVIEHPIVKRLDIERRTGRLARFPAGGVDFEPAEHVAGRLPGQMM